MSISIIIPTLNEASCLAETLRASRRQRPREIIVVDGGSTDETTRVAAAADVLIEKSVRGRAFQMNLGASRASGDILLFLHADCTLEPGALDEVERLLESPRTAAGCFCMRVQAAGVFYRSIDACSTARVRLFGMIYGDQGLFVKRDRFQHLGGFPPLHLMEDIFLSTQLRHSGRVVVARRKIYVSPRRWQQTGLVRQTLRNWSLTAMAALGVSPNRLGAYYPAVR